MVRFSFGGTTATLAKLVVELETRTEKLKAGLDQAAGYARSFADRQTRILDNAGTTSKLQADLARLQAAYVAAQARAADFVKTANGLKNVSTGQSASAASFQSARSDAGQLAAQVGGVRDHIAALQADTAEQERLSAALQRASTVQGANNAEVQKSVGLLQSQATALKLADVGASLASTGRKLSLFLTAPITAAGLAAAKFGADAELAGFRMNLVFGSATGEVNRQIETLRRGIPATTAELQKFVALLDEEYVTLGIIPTRAREMSVELVKVAGALALFKGRSVEDALQAIRSATNGLTRPLRDFGVVLDQNSIKQEATRLGLLKHGEALMQLARVQSVYSLIEQRSGIQQASANELLNTGAIRAQFAAAQLRELRNVVGAQLVPVLLPLVTRLTEVARSLSTMDAGSIRSALLFAGLVAAIGPVTRALGFVTTGVGLLVSAVGVLRSGAGLAGLVTLLTPQGLIVAGLLALAGAFYFVWQKTHQATSGIDDFKRSIATMPQADRLAEQLGLQASLQALVSRQAAVKAVNVVAPIPKGANQTQAAIIEGGNTGRLRDQAAEFARIGTEIQGTRDKLRELSTAYNSTATEAAHSDATMLQASALGRQFAESASDATQTAASALADQAAGVTLIIDRIQKARETLTSDLANDSGTKDIAVDEADYEAAIRAALDTQTRLTAQIAAAKGHSAEQLRLTKEMDSVTKGIRATFVFPKVTLPDIKPVKIDVELDLKKITAGAVSVLANDALLKPLRDAAEQASVLRAELEIRSAARVAQGKRPLNIDAAFKIQRDYASVAGAEAAKAIAAMNLPLEVQKGLLDQIQKYMDTIGVKGNALKEPFDGVAQSLSKSVSLLRSAGDLANALGNSALGNLLNTSANLADNLSKAIATKGGDKAADIGSITGAIALATQLLNDPTKAEQRAVVRANTAALQQVSLKLTGFIVNASNTVAASSALSALFANQSAARAVAVNQSHKGGFLGTQTKGDLQSQLDALNPVLKQFGLTFDQLTAIAKNYGVTLTDKSGRLVVDALGQLRTGFLDAAKAAFAFSSSFSDQNTLAELRDKIAGKTTPADDLKRQVALIQSIAPTLLQGTFDTTAATGQQALRSALSGLVEGLANKTINPSAFGGFSNLSELTGVVGSVIDALNGMQTSVSSVTQSLVNVAPYFKVDAARYNATLPNTLTSGGAGFNGGLTPLSPTTIPTVTATVTHTGDVNINIEGAGKNAREIAIETRQEYQNMALARFGTTTRWAETQ